MSFNSTFPMTNFGIKTKTMASGKLFYNVLNKESFEKKVAEGKILQSSIAFIPSTREVWTHGVYYPCDFSAPMLPSRPTPVTVSYTDSLGYIRDFMPGQACMYLEQGADNAIGVAVFKGKGPDGEGLWEDMGNVRAVAQEAMSVAREAESLSQDAYAYSTQALDIAATARGSVAALEGLADTTEAQRTLAALVTQIQDNTYRIQRQEDFIQVMSKKEYESLEAVDPSRIYMVYED